MKKDHTLSVGLSVAQGLSYLNRGTPEAEHIWNFGVDTLSAAEIHRDHAEIAECIRLAAKTLGHTHHSRTIGLLNHIEEQYEKYDGTKKEGPGFFTPAFNEKYIGRRPQDVSEKHPTAHASAPARDPHSIDVM